MAIKPVAFLITTRYDGKLMIIIQWPAEGNIGYSFPQCKPHWASDKKNPDFSIKFKYSCLCCQY